MNSFSVFRVSASALESQKQRMNVIASNMANAGTTRTEEGGPYKRKDVVFSATTIEADPSRLEGVKVAGIREDNSPPKMIYDPAHPDADKDGYVAMPNISTIEEMVNMMTALRAYDASVAAFNMAKTMFMKTLELGRQ